MADLVRSTPISLSAFWKGAALRGIGRLIGCASPTGGNQNSRPRNRKRTESSSGSARIGTIAWSVRDLPAGRRCRKNLRRAARWSFRQKAHADRTDTEERVRLRSLRQGPTAFAACPLRSNFSRYIRILKDFRPGLQSNVGIGGCVPPQPKQTPEKIDVSGVCCSRKQGHRSRLGIYRESREINISRSDGRERRGRPRKAA